MRRDRATKVTRAGIATSVSGAALAAALAAGGAQAQDATPAPDDAREVVVVTGVGVPIRIDPLEARDILDITEVEADFDGSLGASLAGLPGVSTTSFGPAVGRPIIRGLGGERVRILTNGVGGIDAAVVSVDHAVTTEALEAERIEVLRGASAIAYGGGAIGGVVNVVDGRVPDALPEGGFDGRIYLGATTVDDGAQAAGRARFGAGSIAFQLEALHREADDFEIPGFAESARQRALEAAEEAEEHGDEDHDEEEEEAFGIVENSDFTFDTYGAGVSFIGERGFIGVSVRQMEADYGLPGHEHGHGEEEEGEEHGEEEEEEEGDVRLELDQIRYDVRGELALDLGPFERATLSLGISDYEHVEVEGEGEIGTTFSNEGWELRAALLNGVSGGDASRWSGTVGVQAFQTDFSAVGEEAFVPPVETNDIGVFAAQRYDLGGYGFDGGARLEYSELEPSVGDDRDFTAFSAAFGGFVEPRDGLTFGASLARSERAPSDAELYSDGPHAATETFEIGDPDLDKEIGWSLDFTARADGPGWRVEAGAFTALYTDFIFLAPTGEEDPEEGLPIFRYLQDDATLWGGEISAASEIGSFGGWALTADALVEYVRGETDSLGDLPQIPPLAATFGLEGSVQWIDLRAELELVSDQNDTAAFELDTDGYAFTHLSATIRPFADRDIRVIAGLQNAFDEEGRLHTSQLKDVVPLPGRAFRIALSASF